MDLACSAGQRSGQRFFVDQDNAALALIAPDQRYLLGSTLGYWPPASS
jgi:hypothetical protein